MKRFLLFVFFLLPFMVISQNWNQIGQDIDGEAANDWSGVSVSTSSDGNILAVGAHSNDGNGPQSGHVRIYENNGGSWVQLGQDIDGEANDDHCGHSVSLSSDGYTLAIGAPFNDGNGNDAGHVRVYNWDGSSWNQLGQDIDGEAANDHSGYSISLSDDGNRIAIGAEGNNDGGSGSGHLRIYENVGGSWIQLGQDIDGEAANDNSGRAVSISGDGNIVAVGSPYSNANGSTSGQVRIYEWNGTNWSQKGTNIVPVQPSVGTYAYGGVIYKISGSTAYIVNIHHQVYTSRFLSNCSAIVNALTTNGYTDWQIPSGTDLDDICPSKSFIDLTASNYPGTVTFGSNEPYVSNQTFCNSGNNGSGPYTIPYYMGYTSCCPPAGNCMLGGYSGNCCCQVADFWLRSVRSQSITTGGQQFGWSVDLNYNGNIIVVGAISGSSTGFAEVYNYDGSSWNQLGNDINGEASGDHFGESVSINNVGDRVVIGAPWNDDNGSNSGHVRVYENSNGAWSQIGQDIDGEAAGDDSGWFVSLSSDGSTLAIGAKRNDGNGSNSGHVRVYQFSVPGCMDSTAFNFSPNATTDDGSCIAVVSGCIDSTACNYDASANVDDGSCDLPNGCGDSLYLEYNSLVTCSDVSACLNLIVSGCTDTIATNYNLLANIDDGSCCYSSYYLDSVTSCDSYTWTVDGQTYNTSGVYINLVTDSLGCPHIDSLVLTINNSTSSLSTITACDSYTWFVNGATYTESVVDINISTNAAGCIQADTLVLTIDTSTSSSMIDTACDSYVWLVNGQTYTQSGIYIDTNQNALGCTNIDTLVLTIDTSTSSSSTITACDSYVWPVNGQTYTQTGIYTDVSTNNLGCTHISTLFLTINNSTSSLSTITACDSYTWNGNTYTTSGTYIDVSANASGCTHTATLVLTIDTSTSSLSTITACDSYVWLVNGQTYTQSGIYIDANTNALGCTNIDSLVLTINISTISPFIDTACDSYFWSVNGQTYTTSGNYTYVSTNPSGCTHISTLALTIYTSTSSPMIDVVTNCDSYTWNGNTYTTSGTYIDVSTNAFGCNHTETLDLTINNSTSSSMIDTACDSYIWPLDGQTYTQSGVYTIVSTNALGCTHIDSLVLTINNSTDNLTTVTSCGSYFWSVNGQTYTQSGTYTYSTINASGCAHSETLVAFISNSENSSDTVTTCDSYNWTVDGQTYDTSGVYINTFIDPAGCTHVDTLHLTIAYSTSIPLIVHSICDSYTWNGQTYTTSGTYTYSTTNASGCDYIETLELIINSTSSLTTTTACDSYSWSVDGQTYTASGIYTSVSTNALGCTHTDSLVLTIDNSTSSLTTITSCDPYTWSVDGQTYTTSGTYTVVSTNANGCEHIDTLDIAINSTSSSTTVTTCDSYMWSVNGDTYTMSGTYTDISTNANGCDHIETLDLTVNYSSASTSNVSTCDSYNWNGQTYTSSGTYTHVISDQTVIAGSHSSPYAGTNTRGYYFQAQSDFHISSLSCADETAPSATRQSVELVDFGVNPPAYNQFDFNGTSTPHTVLFSAIDVAAGWKLCDVNIVAGNYYGIIGAKHDAGGTIMYNSYTTTTEPQTVMIDGNEVTLNRMVLQGSLASGSPVSGSYWTDPNYNIGRIHFKTDAANGCDSTATLNLTISSVIASINQSGNSLYSVTTPVGLNADWYNIQNDNGTQRVWLMEEGTTTFTPTFECSYFIVVSDDGCVDTSETYYYGANASRIGSFTTSPNPTSGFINVKFENPKNQFVMLELISHNGSKLDEFITIENNLDIDLSRYPSGSYYLYFNSKDAVQGCRLEEVQKVSTKIILNK